MKRIINGKRYDTEAAENLASWENMRDHSDFRYESFIVYRTKNGAWFKHYFGGPLSSYGRRVGSEHHSSEGLQPLSQNDAREHLERCGIDAQDALERYFPVEDA